MRRTLLTLVLLALLAMASIQVGPAPAHAEVSAECRLHLERVEAATGQHVTAAADRRHWLERGQKSLYCSEQDANEDPESSSDEGDQDREAVGTRGPAASPDHDEPDKKSRYCRKHWYC
ncbi:hypothetical protein SEA_DALMATIAN_83 [Mycobacterium phage Dalmatian]|nr:hypothetical protein SEA_DALMATIAN_83 [Mycobacterium phage Dalmatian]